MEAYIPPGEALECIPRLALAKDSTDAVYGFGNLVDQLVDGLLRRLAAGYGAVVNIVSGTFFELFLVEGKDVAEQAVLVCVSEISRCNSAYFTWLM